MTTLSSWGEISLRKVSVLNFLSINLSRFTVGFEALVQQVPTGYHTFHRHCLGEHCWFVSQCCELLPVNLTEQVVQNISFFLIHVTLPFTC